MIQHSRMVAAALLAFSPFTVLAGSFDAGSFVKATRTPIATQAVPGVGFSPQLVLLQSSRSATTAAVAAHARYSLGVGRPGLGMTSALQDTDGLATTSVDSTDRSSKALVVIDNATRTIDAEADVLSFDADGFTRDWTTNHAVATEILYLALGSSRRLIQFQ